MDVLNFISWIRSKKILKTLPKDSLIPVGVRDTRRDDRYNTYAIKAEDLNLGGGGEVITLNTYQELYNLVVNEKLVPGNWYKFPYRSVNFLNGWNLANNNPTPIDPSFDPRKVYVSKEEMLLAQAISTFEIANDVYSEKYPEDVIQFAPYTNKIGVDIGGIFNGTTLPDSSVVSGFDLKWDGKNVYFDMPTGYPALFGHYFYVFATFSSNLYSQDGAFEPLTPVIAECQYNYSDNLPMSKISISADGMKVIMLNLTQTDYNNYDADSLYVDTVYAIGDAYGWVTKRNDTQRNISVPFDFRSRVYRRYEVDLTPVNAGLGIGYYGKGDNPNFYPYGNIPTTGNYIDVFCLENNSQDIYNIEWNDMGGPDVNWYAGYNDNVVFLGACYNNKIGFYCYDNTIGTYCTNNTIGIYFRDNTIGNSFQSNNISDAFQYNIIANSFYLNTISSESLFNVIGDYFQYNSLFSLGYNTISSNFIRNKVMDGFAQCTIKDFFTENVITQLFTQNTIDSSFRQNIIETSLSTGVNFTLATHVYGDYNCTIFKRSDGTLQLSYVNNANTVQYTTITA